VSGIVAELKEPLRQRVDLSEVLVGSWVTLSARELSGRPAWGTFSSWTVGPRGTFALWGSSIRPTVSERASARAKWSSMEM
jgi:hypothetical protein